MTPNPDVIIIGAGVIGLSAAWRLAKRGLRVSVLEQAGDIPGASSTSLGVLAPPSPLGDTPFHALHRASLASFPHFAEELREDSGIDIAYKRTGSLEVIPSEDQFCQAKKEVELVLSRSLEFAGEPVLSLLSPKEACELEHRVFVPDFGALYCPVAAQLSVDKTLAALCAACERAGVKLLFGSRVTSLLYKNTRICGVQCECEHLSSAKVLVAAGAWTSELSPELDLYAHMEPVRGQAILVHGSHDLAHSIVKWKKRYIVPQGEGLFALGSTTERDKGFDVSPTVDGISQILSTTQEVLPCLSQCSVQKVWAGLRPAGQDSKPNIGAVPSIDGLFVATGHYKIGFGFTPITASSITEMICDGHSTHDLSTLAPRDAKKGKKKRGCHGDPA